MKKSPKQQILELIGATEGDEKWSTNANKYKGQLLDKIVKFLDREDGESDSELKARLLGDDGNGSISNKKLIKLYNTAQRLQNEFGGEKSKLIDSLLQTQVGKSGKVDEDYRRHLEKKSVATLLLTYDHAVKAGEVVA